MVFEVDLGDGGVGEHGVESAEFEIAEVVHVLVVHAHLEAGLPGGQSVRQRGGQHSDAAALEVRDRADAGVLGAGDELLPEGEVRPAHGHLGEVLGRALEGRDDDVEIAALAEAGDEVGPVVLDEAGLASEAFAQGLGEFDLEADELVGLVWRVEDVRRTALGVVGPPEHPGEGGLRGGRDARGGRGLRGGARAAGAQSAGGPRHEEEEHESDWAHRPAISGCASPFSSQ